MVNKIPIPQRMGIVALYASNAIELVCLVFTAKLVYLLLGLGAFTEYVLARRALGVIVPILIMGQGIVLTRRIALDRKESGGVNLGRLVLTTIMIVFGISLATFAIGGISPLTITSFLYGGQEHEVKYNSLATFVAGSLAYGLTYSIVRGIGSPYKIAVCQALLGGMAPLAVVLLFRENINETIAAMGIVAFGLSVLMTIIYIINMKIKNFIPQKGEVVVQFREGFSRVPGDLAYYALLTLPTVLMAWTTGLACSAVVALAFTVLGLSTSFTAPFAAIILPRAASGELSRRYLIRSLAFGAVPSALVSIYVGIWPEDLILIMSGPEMLLHKEIFQILVLGMPFLSMFAILRNVMDGWSSRPISGYISMISLAPVLIVSGMNISVDGIGLAVSCLVSFVLLMALSAAVVYVNGKKEGGHAWVS